VKNLILVAELVRSSCARWEMDAYPARIWIKEPPPNSIGPDLFHAPTPVQKHTEHSFPQVNYLLILLRIGGVGSVVCHGMLLGYGRDDERRM